MIYNINSNEWTSQKLNLEPDISFKSYCSAVALDNRMILLIGGGFSNEIYEFNPFNSKITLKANMAKIRTEHSSIKINEKIFIIGGFEKKENTFLSDCEVYDTKLNTITQIESMKIPKCGFSCATTNKLAQK